MIVPSSSPRSCRYWCAGKPTVSTASRTLCDGPESRGPRSRRRSSEDFDTSKGFPLFRRQRTFLGSAAESSWLKRLLLPVVRERFEPSAKLYRKLLRSPFGFQNCTKIAKYQALEKNVVSNRKLP